MTENEIVPFLLKACPEFGPRWKEHVESWRGQAAGNYNDAGEFAHFLIECYEGGQSEVLTRAFTAIEELIRNGNEEVKGIAIVGHLESLQNLASWKPHGSEVFVDYMLPCSRAAWYEIHKWWIGKTSLMDVVRAERAQQACPATDPPTRTSDDS